MGFCTQWQLTATMHHSERIQSKPAKETVHGVKSAGNQAELPGVPSWGDTQEVLPPPASSSVKCCHAGKLTGDSVPRDFAGGR